MWSWPRGSSISSGGRDHAPPNLTGSSATSTTEFYWRPHLSGLVSLSSCYLYQLCVCDTNVALFCCAQREAVFQRKFWLQQHSSISLFLCYARVSQIVHIPKDIFKANKGPTINFRLFYFCFFLVAAVTSLAKFGASCDSLLDSVLVLLDRFRVHFTQFSVSLSLLSPVPIQCVETLQYILEWVDK